MRDNSLQFRPWQAAFLDEYLRHPRPRSLLIASPGTGKTITALYAAKEMRRRRLVDSILVLSDLSVVREQWRHAANEYELELGGSVDQLEQVRDGVVLTIQALRFPRHRSMLEQVARTRRWFVIVDDVRMDPSTADSVVDGILGASAESKALIISGTPPATGSFDREFRFNAQYILERSLIELPQTQIQLARFSPSFALLRRLQHAAVDIDDLSWREFETLIAALLEKDGYKVELMQGSRDGGVDVVALKDLGTAGSFKTLWQAKKKKPGNKVGLSVVRELADTRHELGASKGIIVTSTYLTRGALERVEKDNYILGKVDRDDLESWVRRTLFRAE